MCEPITLSTGAAWALGVSAAATAAATYVAYDANKDASKANAAIAANNERLAQEAARDANAAGDQEAQRQAWRTRAIMGQQRAAVAAAGLDPTMGTPSEILGETAMFGEVDQRTIRLNAARQAWGFNAQATNIGNQNRLDQRTARGQRYGTILGGVGSMANMGVQLYG
jgi:hypothetical protein